MKSKALKLLSLSLVIAGITACNSNSSGNETSDSTTNRDEMSQGMGTVQTDTMLTDSTHRDGMQGDTLR